MAAFRRFLGLLAFFFLLLRSNGGHGWLFHGTKLAKPFLPEMVLIFGVCVHLVYGESLLWLSFAVRIYQAMVRCC